MSGRISAPADRLLCLRGICFTRQDLYCRHASSGQPGGPAARHIAGQFLYQKGQSLLLQPHRSHHKALPHRENRPDSHQRRQQAQDLQRTGNDETRPGEARHPCRTHLPGLCRIPDVGLRGQGQKGVPPQQVHRHLAGVSQQAGRLPGLVAGSGRRGLQCKGRGEGQRHDGTDTGGLRTGQTGARHDGEQAAALPGRGH